jgi:hypothetical protein
MNAPVKSHARYAFALIALLLPMSDGAAQVDPKWAIHAPDRPQPRVVDPGPAGAPVPAPRDAIVLFDGKDLSHWRDSRGAPARWKLENGYVEIVPGTGSLVSADSFGDAQLHVEWATPAVVKGRGQGPGNSGVYLMSTYELQVLDSYQNPTYPDGQAGAIYGQHPPLVNASRPPGQWQTFDIFFRAPRFDAAGNLLSPARMTVLHNNILVQNNVELTGPTGHYARPPYKAHAARLPIFFQDHGEPVRYRNIWIRPLE